MSFFKRLVHPNTKASAGQLKGNEDAETTSADPPVDELFSTHRFRPRSNWQSRIHLDRQDCQSILAKGSSCKRSLKARILTFGYDADIIRGLSTAGNSTLRDHGKALAEDLAIRRKRTDSNLRPIIFVAHSLGGLVVEQALLISRGSAQQHVKDLVESTVAIAFMGTPHLGADLANWGHPISKLSNLLRKTNSDIVGVLQPGSEMLAAVQQEFHTMLNDRSRNGSIYIDIYCFYEEVGYPGIGEIVPKQSAILTAYPNNGIHATHTGMTKFKTSKDIGYVRVHDQLWLWYNAVDESQAEWKEKKDAAKRQQQHYHQPAIESGRMEASHHGPVFNGSISGHNVMAGPQVTGGSTATFNFS